MRECRFCLSEGEPDDPFLEPCACRGSAGFVHRSCLAKWRETDVRPDQDRKCPVCLTQYRSDVVKIYPRERVPDYRSTGYQRLLVHPVLLIVLTNYLFLIYVGFVSLIYHPTQIQQCHYYTNTSRYHCVHRIEGGIDVDHYLSSFAHLQTVVTALYLSFYYSLLLEVRDPVRYLRHWIPFAWVPVGHLIIIELMPYTFVLGGICNHLILPQYLWHHATVLRRMNAEF
jgi:hypothetical protein